MSDERRKNLGPGGEAVDKSGPCGPEEETTEPIEKPSLARASGEISEIVADLANIAKLVSHQAEHGRALAARLTEVQGELVLAVRSVTDLANTAAGLTRKIEVGSLLVESDLRPAARGAILLARILRGINGLSATTAATIESQTSTSRALVDIVGKAAEASIYLAGKATILAEEARTVLPALTNKNLVQAELECLTGELQKVVAEFRRESEGVGEAVVNVLKQQLPTKPPSAN
jgi:hypothetical protein